MWQMRKDALDGQRRGGRSGSVLRGRYLRFAVGRDAQVRVPHLADVSSRLPGWSYSVPMLRHHLGWWPTNRSISAPAGFATEPSVTDSDARHVEAAAQASPIADISAAELEAAPKVESAPAFTERWHHTSDGARVPALMRLTHTSVFHPGYNRRQPHEAPPSVKVGMLVGCQPIDLAGSGTGLRAKFLAFLKSPDVRTLIEALTGVEPGASWKSLAGHGPRTLEAVLTANEDPLEGVPVASALFLPPTGDESLYGRDGRSATLMLYVEPRTADGHIPPASDLTTWSRRFSLALAAPRAFVGFLGEALGLATSNDPPAQLGVWLQSPQGLSALVDIDGLRVLLRQW